MDHHLSRPGSTSVRRPRFLIVMRILLVSTSSGSRGGGEIFLHYLGQALADLGHTIGLWVSDHERMDGLVEMMEPYTDILRVPYTNTYDLPGRSLQAYWRRGSRTQAFQAWHAWNPDIVHLNKQNLEDGLDLLRALDGAPATLTTIHITQSARYLKASKAAIRDSISRLALHRQTGPYVTVSDKRGDDLCSVLVESRVPVHTIYNGIPVPRPQGNCEQLRRQIGVSDEDILITMVGRLTAQKSPDIFLDQANKLAKQYPKARFLWIGSGDDARSFDQTVSSLGLQQQVQRLEWQDNVAAWLEASDIYLHTAAYEGLPLALLEALSAGLPCITSRGVLEEAEPLKHSPVLSYDKDWSFLLESAEERQSRARACRALFNSHFTAEKMARNYEALYEQLLLPQLVA